MFQFNKANSDNLGDNDKGNLNDIVNVDDSSVSYYPPAPPASGGSNPLDPLDGNRIEFGNDDVINSIESGSLDRYGRMFSKMAKGDYKGAMKEVTLDDVKSLASQFKRKGRKKDPNFRITIDDDVPYGGFDGDNNDLPSGHGYNLSSLSISPHPSDVRLTTGIECDCYTPKSMVGETNYHYPLHLNHVNLNIPTAAAANTSSYYWRDAVLFDLRNTIIRKVPFTPQSSLITTTNLTQTFNALINALQVYYSLTAMFVYCRPDDATSKYRQNDGIMYLVDSCSSTAISLYTRLERILLRTPKPRNLNDLVFWFTQIYTTSSTSVLSPHIMFLPFGFTTGTPTYTNEIQAAIDNLVLFNDTFALIGDAFPQWYETPLLTGSSNPKYDPDFETLWVNSPYMTQSTSGAIYDTKGPSVSGPDARIYFNSYGNDLDGGVYGMLSIWDTVSGSWIPSLMTPFKATCTATTMSSRTSYASRSTGFITSDSNDTTAFGRDDTYTVSQRFTGSANVSCANGFQRVMGVSANSIGNCANDLFDWMLTWSSTGVDNYNGNSKSSKPNSGYKKKKNNKSNKDKGK